MRPWYRGEHTSAPLAVRSTGPRIVEYWLRGRIEPEAARRRSVRAEGAAAGLVDEQPITVERERQVTRQRVERREVDGAQCDVEAARILPPMKPLSGATSPPPHGRIVKRKRCAPSRTIVIVVGSAYACVDPAGPSVRKTPGRAAEAPGSGSIAVVNGFRVTVAPARGPHTRA